MEARRPAEVIQLPRLDKLSSEAILRVVQNRVTDKADYLLSGLQMNIANALFEEMRGIDQDKALTHHFNIMRAFKLDESTCRANFHALLHSNWETFPQLMDEGHIEMPRGEVADWISALSRRTENHYKVLLNETRSRFQTLLSRKVDRHPLLPDIYYRAFWQSIAFLDLGHRERRFVLPLFHRFFMDRYGQLIGVANRAMIRLEVEVTR
jgi:hypothetical protein